MADIVERFDYDIEPALRKLRQLDRATEEVSNVEGTVIVEIEGLDDLAAGVELLAEVVEASYVATLEVDQSQITDAANAAEALEDVDPTVDIEVETSTLDDALSSADGLNQDANINLEVDGSGIAEAASNLDAVEQEAIEAEGATQNLTLGFGNLLQAGLALEGIQVVVSGITGAVSESITAFDGASDSIIVATGASGDALAGLENDFLNVAGNVQQSFDESAFAIGNLNTLLGFTGDELSDLSVQLLDATRLLGEAPEAGIESFGKFANQANLSAQEASDLADFLFSLTQRFGIGLTDLTNQMATLRPVLSETFSDTEIATFIGTLDSVGVSATSIQGPFSQFLRQAAEAGEDPRESFESLVDQILNAETAAEALDLGFSAFGARGGAVLTQALRDGTITLDELGANLEDTRGLIAETDEATLSWNQRLGELRNRVLLALEPVAERVFGAIGAGAQRAGEIILPFLNEVRGAIRAFVVSFQIADGDITSSGLAGFFERLGFVAAQLVDQIQAVAPIIRQVFVVVFDLAIERAQLLIDAALRIGSAIGDAFADVDLVEVFGQAFERAGAIFSRVQTVITAALEALLPAVERIIGRIVEFFSSIDIGPVLDALGQAFQAVFEVIEDIDFEAIFENLADIFDFLLDILEPIVEFLIDILAPAFEDVGDILANVIGFIANLLEGDWRAAWNSALGIVQSVVNLIVGILGRLLGRIAGALAPVGQFITGVWNGIASTAQSAWNGILSTISGIVDGIGGAIESAFSGVEGFISSVWNGIAGTAQSAWNGITGTIGGAVEGIASLISTGFGGAQDAISSVWNGIASTAESAWNGITSVISGAIDVVGDAIVNGTTAWIEFHEAAMEAIIGVLSGAWETVTGTITDALAAIEDTIVSVWNGIVGTITGVGTAITGAFSSIWETVSTGVTDTFTGIVDTIRGALSDALTTITGFIGDFLQAGADLGSSIIDGLSDALSAAAGSLASVGTAIANAIIGALNQGLQFINDFLPDSIPIPGLPDIDLPDNPLPLIPTLAEGAYIPATRGGVLALLAENRHGEVALNEGQSFARNVGLLSEFQGGAFLRQLADEVGRSAGAGGGSYTDNRSWTLTVPAPPTQNPKIWGDELMARMKRHTRDQDQQRAAA